MTAPEQTEARRRLALLIEERANELGMTWNELAEKAGLTKEGLRGVRFGSGRMRRLTKSGLEGALEWTPGSVDQILGGGEPGKAARGDLRIGGRDPAPQVDDEKLQRATELLAEGMALLEEIRRERRQGA